MIPHGLAACELDTTSFTQLEVCMLDMSVLGFTFRLPKHEVPRGPQVRIRLHMLFEGENLSLTVTNAKFSVERQEDLWTEFRLETCDERYKAAVRTFSKEYSVYVSMKSEEDTDAIRAAMCREQLPDEGYCADIDSWRRRRAERIQLPRFTTVAKEIAVMLGDPDLIKEYLESPVEVFFRHYCAEHGFADHPVSQLKIDCVYIGNRFCTNLMTDAEQLERVIEKAFDEHLRPVLCLPPIPEDMMDTAIALAEYACGAHVPEITVNDWGMLSALSEEKFAGIEKSLDVFLCKRRKDPRASQLRVTETLPVLSSVDSDDFRGWISQRFGKVRYSRESGTGGNADVLYWPLAQLNTAEYCGISALCRRSSRGAQMKDRDCPRYCRDHYLFYPDRPEMLGKYNTVFALLKPCGEEHFERLVIDLP